MKKVMVFGTFDYLHPGHRDFFAQAKKHGDYLMVVVALDENVLKIKGQLPDYSQVQRLRRVQNCPEVDLAILGQEQDRLAVIIENKPAVICLGYDQDVDIETLKSNLLSSGLEPEIYRLSAYQPDLYKSSIIRHKLLQTYA